VTRRFAVLILLVAALAFGQRKEPVRYAGHSQVVNHAVPPSMQFHLAGVRGIELQPLSKAELAMPVRPGAPRQVGLHRSLPADALDRGVWVTLPSGKRIWQLAIQSMGAARVRIQFGGFAAGTGRIWVHNGAEADGPYSGGGPYGNGEFWSGMVAGDRAIIEYEPGAETNPAGRPPFHIRSVAHLTTDVTMQTTQILPLTPDPAAPCNLDVNCYPDWQTSRNSVAELVFEMNDPGETGTYVCSGSLVGTRDNSFKPYLYTAAHCIHSEDSARSLQTFWAYQTAACGAPAPTTYGTLNSSNGGHLLESGALNLGDYSLVLLPDVPDGVVFAGWDTADPLVGASVVGIHHPMGSYKRISFGQATASLDVSLEGYSLSGDLYNTATWTQGVVQPGSSGSPLFTAPGVVVGALTYGPAYLGDEVCDAAPDTGAYGKFSVAYTALSDYFEDLPYSIVSPSASSLTFKGVNGTIAGGNSQTVNLTTGAASAVSFKARADEPWIEVSANTSLVSAAAPVSLTVKVDPSYLTDADTYAGTVTILSGAAPPQYINVSVSMAISVSKVTITANPNPVVPTQGPDGPLWTLNLKLRETNGVATQLTGLLINGTDYSPHIAKWFDTADIKADGSISATITTSGLIAATDEYFEFLGTDPGSGKTWHQQVVVSFAAPNP
jgi:hypothetical protein